MPVYICIVRRAQCCICNANWDLDVNEPHPKKCPECNAVLWEFGVENPQSRKIRQGIIKAGKILNPGAKSKKRQDRGRAQHRQFKKRGNGDEAQRQAASQE